MSRLTESDLAAIEARCERDLAAINARMSPKTPCVARDSELRVRALVAAYREQAKLLRRCASGSVVGCQRNIVKRCGTCQCCRLMRDLRAAGYEPEEG